MLTTNLKVALAIGAALAALIILVVDPGIVQGTGLIVATLAAGAGWLVRDTHEEARRLRSICQAYVAVIEAQFEEINAALSDDELNRFLSLAPGIAVGSEPESLVLRAPDPFALLPELRDHLHLLSPGSARLLWKWRVLAADLFDIYELLGSKQLSSIGPDRLAIYFQRVKRCRDEYRDVGYAALLSLKRELPALQLNVRPHEDAGACTNALAIQN